MLALFDQTERCFEEETEGKAKLEWAPNGD